MAAALDTSNMAAFRKAYRHSPLSSTHGFFRLMVLLPGEQDACIECQLLQASMELEPRQSYEALSYTWGRPEHTRAIVLEGQQFLVRDNLFWALYHLRSGSTRRVLWVDAICIDQSNVAERNDQVQQMANIYSQATKVLIWLGLGDEDSKVSMAFLNQYERSVAHGGKNNTLSGDRKQWVALSKLCSREYWERVWIVQEIGLAKRLSLVCGRDRCSWFHFARICQTLYRSEPRHLSQSQLFVKESLPARLNQQRGTRKKSTLWSLLKDCEESRCQDPRDIVYGFLGLAEDYTPSSFAIDYDKSLEDVYCDVMLFQYAILMREETSNPGSSGTRILQFSEFLQDMLCGKLCHYNGALRKMFTGPFVALNVNEIISDQSLLRIPASGVAIIREFGPIVTSSDEELQEWQSKTGAWRQNRRYADAILADRILAESSRSENVDYRLEMDLSGLDPHLFYPVHSSLSYIKYEGPYLKNEAILDDHLVQIDSSRFFLGNDGLIGIAPEGSSEGDLICTFEGSSLTAVIRGVGSNYQLVGRGAISSLWPLRSDGMEPEQHPIFHLDLPTVQRLTRFGRLSWLQKESYFEID